MEFYRTFYATDKRVLPNMILQMILHTLPSLAAKPILTNTFLYILYVKNKKEQLGNIR